MSTLSLVFRASIDVAPAETAPITCPPTPSPVDVVDDWARVRVLSPCCTLVSRDEARVMCAGSTSTDEGALARPTKAPAPLSDVASPVVTSEFVDLLAATMLVDPPADVTAPMTSPATPSPVEAAAVWRTVCRLLPSCTLTLPAAATFEMSDAV